MMSMMKVERKQFPRLGGFAATRLFQLAALFALALALRASAESPAVAPQTITGTRRLPEFHSVINFSQLAQREAAVGPSAGRTNPMVAPFMSPGLGTANQGAVGAASPLAAATPAPPTPPVPAVQPASSFPALGDDGTTIPPDTDGAVGPNHLMVALNSQIRIQTRTGGIISTMTTFNFWRSLGVTDVSDPHVVYDSFNNRWIFTMIADFSSPSSSILMAVSQTSDPTGNWFLFQADADPANIYWADYPTLGFNKDWIVVSVNMYSIFGAGYGGAYIYVFDKANLYANGSGAFTFLQDSSTPGLTLAPAVTFDNSLSTLYLVDVYRMETLVSSNRLRISTITGPVGNEVLTLGTAYATATNSWAYYEPTAGGSSPQLGSSRRIEANDTRIINAVYRNGSIWCSHNAFLPANRPTHCAAQWWQIAPDGTVQQFGRVEDPASQIWYVFPSIAVNNNNDVMLGYSSFSPQQYASANYSFRSASDAPGTMEADTVLKAGLAPYFKDLGSGQNRWGDFSATVVDPVNDVDMWTIQEYADTPSGQDRWGTWWGRLDVVNLPTQRIELSAVSYNVAENTPGFATITVNNVGGLAGTVDYSTTDGTAVAGVDYLPANGTLTFASGQVSTNFAIVIIDNAVANSNKTINVSLSNPTGGAILGNPINAVVTIIDDETLAIIDTAGEFNFSSTTYFVTEDEVLPAPTPMEPQVVILPDHSAYGALITVIRTNGASGRVMVDYATVPGGTAIEGIDYIPVTGTLVFDDYQMSTNFLVEVFSDFMLDGDKFVNLQLSNPRPDPLEDPFTIQPTLGLGAAASIDIIEINEGFVTPTMTNSVFNIERAWYRVDEYPDPLAVGGTREINVDVVLLPGGGPGTVRASLFPGPVFRGCEVTVGASGGEYCYPTAAGSDYADFFSNPRNLPTITDPSLSYSKYIDYVPYTTNFVFNQFEFRKTFVLTVTNDPEVEFNEDFLVHLTFIPNNPPVGRNPTANVTILYDDQPAGALDREWNPDGTAATTPPNNTVPGANNIVSALVVQPDGKTLLGGDFTAYNAFPRPRIARCNTDGSVDLTFNPGLGPDDFVSSLALYPPSAAADAGKILIAGGFASVNGFQRNGIARLLPGGAVDPLFNPGNGADGPIRSMALQPDGKVLVSGGFSHFNDVERPGFARLNANGSLDLTFDVGTGADGTVWAITFDSIGRVLVGGDFLSVNNVFSSHIARLNPDGSLDATFNSGGGADASIYAIAVQAGDAILIGGSFTQFDFYFRSCIARLNSDGTLDQGYDPGKGANDTVNAITLQPDNKALIGGFFTAYDNVRRLGLARLKPNGTLDTSFLDTAYNQFAGLINTYSFEPPNFLKAIALQPDGNVMVGGSFHQIGGNPSHTVPLRNPWTVYTRADKRPRYNIARVLGGVTPGPGNAEFDASEYFVDENAGTASIRLRRVDGRLGTLLAINASSNRTAQAGIDYTNLVTTNVWPESARGTPYYAPHTEGFVGFVYNTVPIINNTLQDGNRVLDLNFLRPGGSITLGGEFIPLGGALGRYSAPLTIVDDDFPKGQFNFSSAVYATNENAGFATITVVRTNGSVGAVSVDYFTYDVTTNPPIATAGVDYVAQHGKLSFASGQTSQTFRVPIIDDTLVEFDENVGLLLTNATGGATLPGGTPTSITTATLTILDNDFPAGRINFSASVYDTNYESDGSATITVNRTGGNAGVVSVQFQTLDGTAVNLRDYLSTNGVLAWNDGESTPKTFQVQLLQNGLVTGPATVNLRLLDPRIGGVPNTNLLGFRTNATLIIQDSDSYGSVAFNQSFYQASENGGAVTITVVRRSGIAGTGSVSFAATPGTALGGIDFILTNGVLTFLPGEISKTFQVAIIDNSIQDGNRTLTLALSNPTNLALGTPNPVTLTIVDDESFNEPAGSADVSFRNPLVDGPIYALVLQRTNGVTDGRLVIGGDFATVNHVNRSRLARLLTNGVLDTSFDPGTGADGPIRTTAMQPDGRLLIGGSFAHVADTNRNGIARLTPDGRPDASFNPGSGADNPVFTVVLQPDAKILIGGSFSKFNSITRPGIVRLNTNGSVDLSFNAGSGPNDSVYAIALQNDGKIVIGGEFTQVNGQPFNHLVRLRANGSIDPSFSNFGAGLDAAVKSILVQADGKLVIGGSFTNVNGVSRNYLARLNPDGGLDAQFMQGLPGADNIVYALAAQADGKLVVVGDFTHFNGVSRSRLTRLFTDGATDGTINFGSGADGFITAVVIQPDRKIVIGGGFTMYDEQQHDHIARIHGGAIFGPGTLTFSKPEYDVSESGTNAVIKVKRKGGTTGTVGVDVTTSDGTALSGRDYVGTNATLSFPTGETVENVLIPIIDNLVTNEDRFFSLSLNNFTGGADLGPQPFAGVFILNDESAIGFTSASFSVNENAASGNATISFQRTFATNNIVSAVFKTILGGTAPPNVKYIPTNTVVTFLPGEVAKNVNIHIINETNAEGNETVLMVLTNAVSLPPTTTFVDIPAATLTIVDDDFGPGAISFSAPAYSVSKNGGNAVITVVRTGGTLGIITAQYATGGGTATPGVDYVQQNGTLVFGQGQTNRTILIPIIDNGVAAGDQTFQIGLFNPGGGTSIIGPTNVTVTIVDNRIRPGSLDASFDPGVGPNNFVRSLTVQLDGRVVIGGAFTTVSNISRQYIARLNTNGPLDLTFNPGAGASAFVSSVSELPDARVLLGGGFASVNGTPFNRVARLNTNGSADLGFAPGAAAFDASVEVVAPDPNGRVVAGGSFSAPARGITRLRLDGTVDPSFNPGAGANGPVHCVALQTNGQVLLAGSFTSVNGSARARVARLNADGVLDGGFITTAITNGNVYCLAIQPDGKMVAGGDFYVTGNTNRVGLARLNSDGSLDSNFNAGSGANGTVYALGFQSQGKLVIAGSFTTVNNTNRTRLARLNGDGSLDLSFRPGTGANSTVYALTILPDDNLMIGGDFTVVDGFPRNRVARISANDAALKIVSITLPSGQVQITISSQNGITYVLQSSQNLLNWSDVSTNTASGRTLILTDPAPLSAGGNFYRVRLGP